MTATAPTAARRPAASASDSACDECSVEVESPLSEEEAARHAVLLKALADPTRLRILAILAAQPASEPLCVCDVESAFDLSQPTISHHFKVLREAGLVSVSKRGLWHYYAPVPGALAPLRELLGTLA